MTIATTWCVPPEMAPEVVTRCHDLVRKGLEVAPGVTVQELLDDIAAKRAQLWLVLEGNEALACAMTEILHEGDCKYVAVFGLGGKNIWRWAKSFSDEMLAFAASEGCSLVRFAGSKAWGRLLPHFQHAGEFHGQQLFEGAVA